MYQGFFGLRELPFELTANPKYLFLTPHHREALSNLQYGLTSARAITVLIGEAGTGKTTLLHVALESTACRNVSCVYLNNPALTRAEFVETLSRRFALSPLAGKSKAVLLDELDAVLRERRSRGQITALVIDEAQSMSGELLEEIRLLANSETATDKLLPLVLAGQPELRDRLNEPGLRQLKQRVALRCEIVPFDQEETASYIATRIRTAGGDASTLFTRDAVVLIHQKSGGIPRVVSVICDNALLTACGRGRQVVDSEIVLEVARDFDLGSGSGAGAIAIDLGPGTSRREAVVSGRDADVQPRPLVVTPITTTPTEAAAPTPAPDRPALAERELFAVVKQPRRFSLFGGRRVK